jgi:hypothetical protein
MIFGVLAGDVAAARGLMGASARPRLLRHPQEALPSSGAGRGSTAGGGGAAGWEDVRALSLNPLALAFLDNQDQLLEVLGAWHATS